MKYLSWIFIAVITYLLVIPIVYSQDMSGEVEMRSYTRNLVCANDFNFAHRDMTETYGKHVVWEGVVHDGSMLVRVYMNKQSGLWTIFEVYPDGSGCASTGGNESMLKESSING